MNQTSSSPAVEVTAKEIHCLSWMDSELGNLLRESSNISMTHSLIINKTVCEEINSDENMIYKGSAFGSCGEVKNPWDSFMQDCGSFEFYLIINGPVRDTCLILNDEVIFSETRKRNDRIGNGTCGLD